MNIEHIKALACDYRDNDMVETAKDLEWCTDTIEELLGFIKAIYDAKLMEDNDPLAHSAASDLINKARGG